MCGSEESGEVTSGEYQQTEKGHSAQKAAEGCGKSQSLQVCTLCDSQDTASEESGDGGGQIPDILNTKVRD